MADFDTRTASLVAKVERLPQQPASPDQWLPDLSLLTLLQTGHAAGNCALLRIINCIGGKQVILAATETSCTVGPSELPALLRLRNIDPHLELLAMLDQSGLYCLTDDERFAVIQYYAEHEEANAKGFFKPFAPPLRKGRGWIQDVRVHRARTAVVILIIQGKNRYPDLTNDTNKALQVLRLTAPPRGKYTTGSAFIVKEGIEAAYRLVPSIVDRLVETGGMHPDDGAAIKQRAFV